MKWLLVLAVLAGGAYLLATNGTFSFYAYNATQDQSGTHVHCYAGCDTDVVQSAKAATGGSASPVVRDALALVAADPSRQTYAETMASLHVLLWRAHTMTRLAGAATIRKNAPGLLSRMDGEDSASLVGLRTAD